MMEIRVMAPRGGKSTALLKWLLDSPPDETRIMVSPSRDLAMHWLRSARQMRDQDPALPSVESWQFVSHAEVLNRSGELWAGVPNRRQIVLGIDDADVLLKQVILWPIRLVMMTSESPVACPTCGSPNTFNRHASTIHGDADWAACAECDTEWGDGHAEWADLHTAAQAQRGGTYH